jgi:TM2 domain-containing membrane protein YozV
VSPSSPLTDQKQRPFLPERRSLVRAYLLWALGLVGVCGVHRIYNRKPLSGALWLLTGGLCFIGQVVDLFYIERMVQEANQPLLLEEALAAADTKALPPIERQLLALARRSGTKGFTLNDALLELQLPHSAGSGAVSAEIQRLLHADLLDVGNDERGRVIYREP